MTTPAILRAQIEAAFRDHVVAGLPTSGKNDTWKSEVRAALGATLETVLSAIGAGIARHQTVADMEAVTTAEDGQLANVFRNNDDPGDAANGVYQWNDTTSEWEPATWYFAALAAVVQPLVDQAEGFKNEAGVSATGAAESAASIGAALGRSEAVAAISGTVQIGDVETLTDLGQSANPGSVFWNLKPLPAGRIPEIGFRPRAAGAGTLCLGQLTNDAQLTITKTLTLTGLTAASKIVTQADDLPGDWFSDGNTIVGYYAASGQAVLAYASSGTKGHPGLLTTAGAPTVGTVTPTSSGGGLQLALYAKVERVEPPYARRVQPLWFLDLDFSEGAQPWKLLKTGTWTFNAGHVLSGSTGIGNSLVPRERMSFEDSVMRLEFEFDGSGAKICFSTEPANPGTYASACAVDMTANTLSVSAGRTAGSAFVEYANVAVPWTLVEDHRYQLEISKKDHVYIYTLTDLVSGQTVALSYDYSVASALDDDGFYPTSEANGSPAVSLLAGVARIYRMQHGTRVKNPRLLIMTDSNGVGFGVDWADTWTKKVKDRLGGDVLLSGVSGANSTGVATQLQHMLHYFFPEEVWAAIGTNDTNLTTLQNNMDAIESEVRRRGGRFVMCLPFPKDGSTIQTDFNAWVRASRPSWATIQLDRALSVNGDGVTRDDALFQADNLHPLATGHAKMYARALLDRPSLFL